VTGSTDVNDPTTPVTREPTPPGPEVDEGAMAPHPGRSVPWPPRELRRGLASPYPPGGVDPDPDAGRREERFYLRLLIAMVLLIVVGGFVVSLIGIVLGFAGSAS
jgi:hypothetical protein